MSFDQIVNLLSVIFSFLRLVLGVLTFIKKHKPRTLSPEARPRPAWGTSGDSPGSLRHADGHGPQKNIMHSRPCRSTARNYA